eukprot:2920958-Prymnesium_polylepis.1
MALKIIGTPAKGAISASGSTANARASRPKLTTTTRVKPSHQRHLLMRGRCSSTSCDLRHRWKPMLTLRGAEWRTRECKAKAPHTHTRSQGRSRGRCCARQAAEEHAEDAQAARAGGH